MQPGGHERRITNRLSGIRRQICGRSMRLRDWPVLLRAARRASSDRRGRILNVCRFALRTRRPSGHALTDPLGLFRRKRQLIAPHTTWRQAPRASCRSGTESGAATAADDKIARRGRRDNPPRKPTETARICCGSGISYALTSTELPVPNAGHPNTDAPAHPWRYRHCLPARSRRSRSCHRDHWQNSVPTDG